MNTTATFDAADVRGPGHWLLAGVVRALHGATRLLAPTPRSPHDDAAAVRALADTVRHSDPGFASDLYAAAARYESELVAPVVAAR